MIAYEIGISTHNKNLRRYIPDVTQPWYADDAGALGTFARVENYFNLITRQGLGHGYYPKPPTSVLILHPENIEVRKEFGAHHILKVCKSADYLGGYIQGDKSKSNWPRECRLM